jgi:hypothetical protein
LMIDGMGHAADSDVAQIIDAIDKHAHARRRRPRSAHAIVVPANAGGRQRSHPPAHTSST